MTPKERLQLAERVYKKAANRVLVVSTGTYGPFGTGQIHDYATAGIEGQAAFVREISKYCDAVVVVTAFMDPHKTGSDEVWQKNTELLLKLTPGIPLGLYECPVPYKRLLSPKLLAWCAQTGRFLFHKVGWCQDNFLADVAARRHTHAPLPAFADWICYASTHQQYPLRIVILWHAPCRTLAVTKKV